MEKTKILIVEDEAIIAEDLKEALEKMGYEVPETAQDFDMAVTYYEKFGADIFIVDITLKGNKTGIDLAKKISAEYHVPFIFLTSHVDETTMQKARECSPGSYLVKPYKKEELFMAVELALKNHVKSEEKEATHYILHDSIFIRDSYSFVKIKTQDILFLKSDGVYIEVHTPGKMHLTRDSFKNIIAKLPPGKFLQSHKSYYINIDHIREISSSGINIHKEEIPVGKTYRDELFGKLGIGNV